MEVGYTSGMEKRVLILDGSIYPDIYRPADEWRALLGGVPADAVRLPSRESVPDLAPYTHIIVTGSEASINLPEPWFDVEADAVRRAFELSKSMLGSCFGHQMLARAISGPKYTAVCPTPEVGWIEVEVTERDELLGGLRNPLHMFASHFDEVASPPPPWKVLARSTRCAVQVMRYGDRPIWGIQSHPEIPPENARRLMEGILARAPQMAPFIGPALLQPPRDDGIAAEIVRRFLNAKS